MQKMAIRGTYAMLNRVILLILIIKRRQVRGEVTSTFKDDKIIGGERTGLIPFMVSVQRDGRHICGGTLLSYFVTMSACHCVADIKYGNEYNGTVQVPFMKPASAFLLQAGDWVLQVNTKRAQRRGAKEIFIHPKCSKVDGILMYDFSLIEVRDRFLRTDYVRPLRISLDRSYYARRLEGITMNRNKCWVIGWGKRNQDTPYMTQFLKKAKMRFIWDVECQRLLSEQNNVFQNYNFSGQAQVCAVGVNWDESDCSGDSGGPVWCEGTIMAIISYGFECGRGDQPAVYAKIENFVDWYKEQTVIITERLSNQLDRLNANILLLSATLMILRKGR